MSKGERMCNVGFNPSGLGSVDQLKGATASIIDVLEFEIVQHGLASEAARCAKIAQQKYEEACMYAVKAMVNKER